MSVKEGTICEICNKEITDIKDYTQVPTFDDVTKIQGFSSFHVSCIENKK